MEEVLWQPYHSSETRVGKTTSLKGTKAEWSTDFGLEIWVQSQSLRFYFP